MGKPVPSLSRSPEESLAIGTAVLAQPAQASAGDIKLYTHLVAAISKGLGLRQWAKNWTPTAGESPNWAANFEIGIPQVQESLQKTLWPRGLPELELSAIALGYIVAEAYKFSSREQPHPLLLIPNLERYIKESRAWEAARDLLIVEATRVANWFADVVRRDLEPDFLRKGGRFTVPGTRYPSLRGGVDHYVYDDENRPKDLDAVKQRVADITAPYRALVKERKSGEHA